MVAITAQNHCNSILEHVRSTNLNFLAQETSFSVYLTIRKTFVKNVPLLPPPNQLSSRDENNIPTEANEAELNFLKSKLCQKESENAALIKAYEDETLESEDLKNQLLCANNALNNLNENYSKLEEDLESLKSSKRMTEKKHEQSNIELKALKVENNDMKKELNKYDFKIKTMKKEAKEIDSQYQKELKKKDDTIDNLRNFKTVKDAEERELKLKQKKLNKKLKCLEERESKLVRKVQNNNISNNNKIQDVLTNPCSPVSHTRAATTWTITNTSYPSTVTHWSPPVMLASKDQFISFISHRVSQSPSSMAATSIFEEKQNLKCEKCDYEAKSEKLADAHAEAHKKMEEFIEELNVESTKLLENVPEDELVFTVEEITTFGLEWKQMERILKIAKEAY